MEWTEYQDKAMRTLPNYQTDTAKLINAALGLTGEAGEVADTIKKTVFMEHPLDREQLMKELGDVAWYFALFLHAAGLSMDDVLMRNIRKLEARYPDGFSAAASLNRKEENE